MKQAIGLAIWGTVAAAGCGDNLSGPDAAPPVPDAALADYWIATYDPRGYDDSPSAVRVDSTGDSYVAGWAGFAPDEVEAALVKYAPDGTQLWTGIWGSPLHFDDQFKTVAIDAEGNAYAVGLSVTGIDRDALIVKYDAGGNEQWAHTFDRGFDDGFEYVAIDDAGHVYAAGFSATRASDIGAGYDFLVQRYDADGTVAWTRIYAGAADNRDVVYAIRGDSAGVIVAGTLGTVPDNGGPTGDDYLTISYAADGTQRWAATYGNPDVPPEWGETPRSIAIDPAGDVIVTGWASRVGNGDALTIKYDASGVEQWTARYHGAVDGVVDGGVYVGTDASGNVYIAGAENVGESDDDFFAVSYSPAGAERWARVIPGTEGAFDEVTAATSDAAGNLYLTGPANLDFDTGTYDALTAKVGADGTVAWVKEYNSALRLAAYPVAIALGADGDVFTTQQVLNTETQVDFVTIKNVNQVP